MPVKRGADRATWWRHLAGDRFGLALRLLLLGLGGAILVRTAWMSDDAYITLRVVDNFVHGLGPRWNVGERVLVFTHPLWFLAVSMPYALTHEAFYTTLSLSIALSAAVLALVAFRAAPRWSAAALALVLLLSSRAFVDYCTSGLENPLTHLLLLLFILELPAAAADADLPRLRRLAILAGFAGVNRLDTLLLFVPGLVVAWRGCGWRRGLRSIALGALPLVGWEGFSLLYYGVLVPNTALAKLASGLPGSALAAQGVQYLAHAVREDPVTMGTMLLAIVCAARSRSGRDVAMAGGIACYLGYVVRVGGDFMSGRFLTAPFLAAVLLLTRRTVVPLPGGRLLVASATALLIALTGRPPLLSGPDYGLDRARLIDAHGIADERRVYFQTAGMWNGAGGPKPVRTVSQRGTELRRVSAPLAVEGVVGVTGYFAGPGVHLIDYYALGDPLLSRLPIVERDAFTDGLRIIQGLPASREGWRIGHLLRTIPAGYAASILTSRNQIIDPAIHRLQDAVTVLTREPIWSVRRFFAIVRGDAARAARAVPRIRAPHRDFSWDEPIQVRPDCGSFFRSRALQRFRGGDSDGARADALEAVRLTPRLAASWSVLGDLEKKRGDEAAAVAAWQRGAEADPEENSPHVALGNWALDHGRYEEAITAFRQALRLNPWQSAVASNLGLALVQLGRPREALPILERSRRIEPGVPDVHANFGFAYLNLDRPQEAIAELREAVRLGGDYEAVWRALGMIYGGHKKTADAVTAFENAARVNPRNADTAYVLSALHQQLGQNDQVLVWLRRAAELGDARALEAMRRVDAGEELKTR